MHNLSRIAGLLIGLNLPAFLSCGCSRGPTGVAEIGAPAPLFELDDLKGGKVALEQYRGKVVLLDFWATWCAPCRRTMPLLDRLQKEFAGDLVLLAINLQEPAEEVRDYVAALKIQSTVLLDFDGRVGYAYRARAIPMQVLIDRQGVVCDILVGLSPTLERHLRAEIQKLIAAD